MQTLLSERTRHKVELAAPQRGDKRSLVDLVCQNAKQSYDQRFRVLQPNRKAIQEALQDALMLAEPPRRIECFDISHIQGAETVASMVVWEDGAMKKADYRKFQIKTVTGVDDFASMREVVQRRYKRLSRRTSRCPSSSSSTAAWASCTPRSRAGRDRHHHAAARLHRQDGRDHLSSTARRTIPSCSTAARPCCTWCRRVRDESHRFAVTYHRKRRQMRDRDQSSTRSPASAPSPASGSSSTSAPCAR